MSSSDHHVEDLSVDWLNTALAHVLVFDVTSFSRQRIAVGQGFLSQLHLLELRGADASQRLSLVLKEAPPADDDMGQLVRQFGLHERELRFYAHVAELPDAPSLAAHLPRPHHVDARRLIMSFCPGRAASVEQGLDRSALQRVLAVLAALHRSLWTATADDNASPLPWLDAQTTDSTCALLQGCFVATSPETDLLRRYLLERGDLPADLVERAFVDALRPERVADTVRRAIGELYRGPRTVIHGDLWCGNVLLTDTAADVVLVDWQFVRFGVPFVDLALLMFSSCDPSLYDQPEHRRALFADYADRLQQPAVDAAAVEAGWFAVLPYIWLISMASITAWIKPQSIDRVGSRYAALLLHLKSLH